MENLTYIDSYFRGELTPEESAAFDQKIQHDPGFADEVAFYCSSMQVAREQVAADKKKRFRALWQDQGDTLQQAPLRQAQRDRKPAVIKSLKRWLAAAAVVAGLLIGWYFYMRPAAPGGLQELADQYIKDNFTTVSVRMAASEDSLDMAKRLYNENKLTEALIVFEQLNRYNSASDETKKLAGVVSLRLKEYDKAIFYFEQLERLTLFDNPGKLYHALALIKRNKPGDKEAAKQLLQEVVTLNLAQKETAAQWLKAF